MLLALAGALTIAFSAILVRLAEVAPETAAFFRCLYAIPLLALLAAGERRRLGPRPRTARDLRAAVAAGTLFAATLIFWHHAIENVGAGLSTVLGNLQVVFVALAAWAALGEKPSTRVLVALPIVLTGVVLISGLAEDGAYGDDPTLGVVYGLLNAVTYAAFILLLRQANTGARRPAGPLLDVSVVASVVALAYGEAAGVLDLTPGWEATAWLLVLALTSQVLGWMLISISLPLLPAALGSVLLLLQPLGSVLLGIAIFDEAPSAAQLVGGVTILAGVLAATGALRIPSGAWSRSPSS